MANPKDFTARQIRTSQLIASGGLAGTRAGLVVYSASIASDMRGGYTKDINLFSGVGDDVYFFVSGSKDSKVARGGEANGDAGVTLFGGDVVFSGTMYADKMVVEVDLNSTGSVAVSGSLFVSQSAFINQGLTVNNVKGSHTNDNFAVYDGSSDPLIKTNVDTSVNGSVVGIGVSPTNIAKLEILVKDSDEIDGVFIDCNETGNFNALKIESLASKPAVHVVASKGIYVETEGTGGYGLTVESDGDDRTAAPLVEFVDQGTSTTTTTLKVSQYGTGDILNLFDGAVEVFTVTDGGNVGIGTDAPAGVLDVFGDEGSQVFILSGSGGAEDSPDESTYTDLAFFVSGTIGSKGTSVKGTSVFGGDLHVSGNISVEGTTSGFGWVDDGDVVRLETNSDRVGIGTVLPVAHLEVKDGTHSPSILITAPVNLSGSLSFRKTMAGATAAAVVLDGDENLALVSSGSSKDIIFKTTAATGLPREIMRLMGDPPNFGAPGTVGINTIPSSNFGLHVSGAVLIEVDGTDVVNERQLVVRSDADNVFVAIDYGAGRKGRIEFRENNSDAFAIDTHAGTPDLVRILDTSSGDSPLLQVDANGYVALGKWGNLSQLPFTLGVWGGDPGNDQVIMLSGSGGGTSPDESAYTDINFFVSGSIGSVGTDVKGASVFGGDMVVSGNLVLDVADVSGDRKLYFDGQNGNQFIYSNGNALYIDGNNYVQMFSNTGIRMYPDDPAAWAGEWSAQGLLINPLSGDAYNFRAASDKIQGIIATDAITDQLLLHSSGSTASTAGGTGIPAGTDVATYISGTVGSVNVANSKGTTLVTSDLVVSGALHIGNSSDGISVVADDGVNSLQIDGDDYIIIRADKKVTLNVNNAETLIAGSGYFGTPRGVVINEPGTADIDFRVETDNREHAIFSNAQTDQVLILSGGGPTDYNESTYTDLAFFVSGAVGNKGSATTRGTTVFGGDVVISGSLYGGSPIQIGQHRTDLGTDVKTLFVANTGGNSKALFEGDIFSSGSVFAMNVLSGSTVKGSYLSGSLTRLADGSPYLVQGSNIEITTGSLGQVIISSTADPSGWTDDGTVVRLSNGTDRVGIGTSSPRSKVNLQADIDPMTLLIEASSNHSGSVAFADAGGATAAALVYENGTDDLVLINSGANDDIVLKYKSAGTWREFRIDAQLNELILDTQLEVYFKDNAGASIQSSDANGKRIAIDAPSTDSQSMELTSAGQLTIEAKDSGTPTNGSVLIQAGDKVQIRTTDAAGTFRDGHIVVQGGADEMEVVINENQRPDVSFRVESDTSQHALYVDPDGGLAGVGEVHIGGPSGNDGWIGDFNVHSFERNRTFFVDGQASKVGILLADNQTDRPSAELQIGNADTTPYTMLFNVDSTSSGSVAFQRESGATAAALVYEGATEELVLVNSGSQKDITIKTCGPGESLPTETIGIRHAQGKNINILNGDNSGTDVVFVVSGAIGNKGSATTRGTAVFGGDVVISGSLYGGSPLSVGSDLVVSGTLITSGSSFLSGSSTISGSMTVTGSLTVSGSDTFTVFGPTLLNAGGASDSDIRMQTANKTHAFFADTSTDQVFILSGSTTGNGATSPDESDASDLAFFVSGSVGSRGTSVKGTSLFGGDLVISGSHQLSGSLFLGMSPGKKEITSRTTKTISYSDIVSSAQTIDTFSNSDGFRCVKYIIGGKPTSSNDRLYSELVVVTDTGSSNGAVASSETRVHTDIDSGGTLQFLNETHVDITATKAGGIVSIKIEGDSDYNTGNGSSSAMDISFERLVVVD